jgi:hypothetical protein
LALRATGARTAGGRRAAGGAEPGADEVTPAGGDAGGLLDSEFMMLTGGIEAEDGKS